MRTRNTLHFPFPPDALCVTCLCLSSADPVYQTVYHCKLKTLGGVFILKLSLKPTDNNHSFIPAYPAVTGFLLHIRALLLMQNPSM